MSFSELATKYFSQKPNQEIKANNLNLMIIIVARDWEHMWLWMERVTLFGFFITILCDSMVNMFD